MTTEYCVCCDKRLSRTESEALTDVERKYHFILCRKCLARERAESLLIPEVLEIDEFDEVYKVD
jgi:hypothetical protein